MNALLRTKVGRGFLGMFLLSALPVTAAIWFGIVSATEAVRQQTHAVLRAASGGAEAQLREFLLSIKRRTEAFGDDDEIRSILKGRTGENGRQVLERARTSMPEAQEIFCLNLEGRVVESSSPNMKGKDESGSIYFKLGKESFYPGDIFREEESGQLRWRKSAPVRESASGRLLGVVVVGIDPGALSSLTTGQRVRNEGADSQSFQIGKTGETYIVNRNGFLLTESRFAPNAILKVKVETEPVQEALERGREMFGDYQDYRGVAVSGASAILRDLGWVVVTEIDFSQAFAPIAAFRNALIWLGVGVVSITTLIAGRFALRIVRPLEMAGEADRELAAGDEKRAMVPEENLPGNEIGDFIRKRNVRIHELIERQRALVKEQKARAEAAAELELLSYSMVHDMRAPLRAIIIFGDLLKVEGEDRLNDAQQGYLSRMRAASVRMDHLICDMLKYSSLLHTEVPLSAVNVTELVRQLIAQNPRFSLQRDRIEVQAGMPLVRANRAILAECFSAFIDNALRYCKPDIAPEISVCAETLEGWVRIAVEDNGMGMPDEFKERVFGIFQKGTHSTEGRGVGLALVRVAVDRMGGRVGVSSEQKVGSRFWIDLKPASEQVEARIV
jgi:signal transduction histidine kinase